MKLQGYDTAQRALRANLSPRYHKLDRLERYADGTQYEGRPNWFSPEVDVPLLERAPCIVYPVVQSAARSNCDMVLGAGRFPHITSATEDDDAEDFALSPQDSEKLDRLVKGLKKQSRLEDVCAAELESAQYVGTAVAIICVRRGKFAIESTKAKWCTPTFSESDGATVTELEIRYPYTEEYYDEDSKRWGIRCMIYRRVIDAQADTTFYPVEAEGLTHASDIDWKADPSKSVTHGLGFCPVIWYRFMKRNGSVAEIDGEAIHKHLFDEIDALNFSLSQRHRAALYCGDPQMYETGVSHEEAPGQPGRQARAVIVPDDRGGHFGMVGGPQASVRRKGPGSVWSYESPQASVGMLTLSADSLKPIDENARDLRAKIAEALSVVFTDPENMRIGSDLSGRALEWLHHKQTARCDRIRTDFECGFLLPALNLMLRMALRIGRSGGLLLPGLTEGLEVLAKFERTVLAHDGAESLEWFDPHLHVVWGPYFRTTEADQKIIVDTTLALFTAGLINQDTALERIAEFYDIDDTLQPESPEQEAKEAELVEPPEPIDASTLKRPL